MPGILEKIRAGKQPPNSLTCPVCGLQGFGSQRGVSQHMKYMHPKALKSMEDGLSVPSDELRAELRKLGGQFDELCRWLRHFAEKSDYRISGLEKDVLGLLPRQSTEDIIRREAAVRKGGK